MNGQSIKIQKFSYLSPVLNEWIKCVNYYVDLFNADDLPYWYNERANVGILAGAAWKAGFVALEEYQTEKISSEGECIKGRNDIYISNADHHACIEAKVIFPDISENNCNKLINSGLANAVSDAREVAEDAEDIDKLGIVFIAPYSGNKNKASDKEVMAFIELIENHRAPIKAWCFHNNAQKPMSHDDRYYPGVAMLMEQVLSS